MSAAGGSTEEKISRVVEACSLHGTNSLIALAGVPGTGKSYIGTIAAQRWADDPLMVREIQFHQSYSYEEFIEGMRIQADGGVAVEPGIFLDWNERALEDPDHKYVLLIDEFTRANVSAVLGEVLTFLEYRDRPFVTIYSRRSVRIARNLTVIVTFNPVDRTAIELDAALLRRLRIIPFPPSTVQLAEMLAGRELSPEVIAQLQAIFDRAHAEHSDTYTQYMPFGHGIFADIQRESPDLYDLWEERIVHFLRRPGMQPHPFTAVIEEAYVWRDADYRTETADDGPRDEQDAVSAGLAASETPQAAGGETTGKEP